MKAWEKYSEYLLSGEWHVHTKYTDGNSTVEEYCRKAEAIGLPLIAITEHVRRELSYDFNMLLSDIEKAREEHPSLVILSGCEAKMLPDGTLDAPEEVLKEAEHILFAFHSFPKDKKLYLETLEKAIENPKVCAWAHPGLYLKKHQIFLEEKDLERILKKMKRNKVLLEVNKKYSLPPTSWNNLIEKTGVFTVRGTDAHSVNELSRTD